jgi:8-oxo-dGTP pyrophosphatase MutT (NUDIX family)
MQTKYSKKAGGVVLNKAGKVLVVAQRHGTWSLPKGGIEEGETELDAATREMYWSLEIFTNLCPVLVGTILIS